MVSAKIRSMDIRGTIARAVDSDGTIRKTLTDDPLRTRRPVVTTPVEAMPEHTIAAPEPEPAMHDHDPRPRGARSTPPPSSRRPRRLSLLPVTKPLPSSAAPAFIPPEAVHRRPGARRLMSSVTGKPEDPINDTPMPLLSHLVELRRRLIWSAVAFFLAFALCYHFSTQIYSFLAQPLADILQSRTGQDRRLIYTALYEAFFTYIKVAFFGGAFLGFPVIASQAYTCSSPPASTAARRRRSCRS